MRTFKKVNQLFVKSNNTVSKILNRYTFSLLLYLAFIIIYNLFWGDKTIILKLLLAQTVSIISSIIIQYLLNLLKGKPKIKEVFDNYLLQSAIILGIFLIDMPIMVSIVAIMITNIIKNIYKGINSSASLYGIIFIVLYKYFTNDLNTPLTTINALNYNEIGMSNGILYHILGINTKCLSPILSIIIFEYLFRKKSIKYNIVFGYITTIIIIMLGYSIFSRINLEYLIFQLTTSNLLFFSIYCLPDYSVTPTTNEGQLFYGIILGIITSILRFIIPELSVIVTLLIGPILFTKMFNTLSFKLKYNQKFYNISITISIILIVITIITLNIIY